MHTPGSWTAEGDGTQWLAFLPEIARKAVAEAREA